MPTFRITAPDGTSYDVTGPDGSTEQDALAQVQAQHSAKPKTQEQKYADALKEQQAQQMNEMGFGGKVLAGIGKAFVDPARGLQQVVSNTASSQRIAQRQADEARKLDAPLMDTGGGLTGNIVGSVAALAPAAFVPGANTVAGAGVVGALGAGLMPTAENESRAKNMALGAGVGAGAQYGLGKVAGIAANRLASKEASEASRQAVNSVRDEAIAAGREAGYKTIPSVSNAGLMGRMVEGATGKVKAAQMASVENQKVTDGLVRKAFGLGEDVPLSKETMRTIRQEAADAGYAPVRAIPAMQTDDTFRNEIRALTSRADNASKDFGELVKSDVKPLVENLSKVEKFSGDTAVDQVAIFRELASDAYAGGNKTLGKAYRGAAEAIEAQIERGLAKGGKDGAALIKDFRAARTKMAQTFDVEKALREGSGSVDARVLGKLYSKSPDRLTGELRTIGRTAAATPETMAVPKDGWSNPITALDSSASMYASILSGGPAPLAVPMARAAIRKGLLSGKGQGLLTAPKYGPGTTERLSPELLKLLEERGIGGLLGAGYAAQ